jgi:hypothetical protein
MATIYRTTWNWFTGWGNGYTTRDINIPPATVVAQAVLHGASGGGTQYAGIKSYRRRLPSGADQNIDFGGWTSWPPLINDRVSSVTFALATASNQQGWVFARMDYWG